MQAIDMIETSSELIQKINLNTSYFRKEIKNIGLEIKDGLHPIVPIMIHDAKLANNIAQDMLNLGIYVVGFSYPVVPQGEARIRVQISAQHSKQQLNQALDAFLKCGKKYNLI